jgi:hypothetical protein
MTLPPEISGERATIRLFAHAKVINTPSLSRARNTRPRQVERGKAAAAPASALVGNMNLLLASRPVGVPRPVITRGQAR